MEINWDGQFEIKPNSVEEYEKLKEDYNLWDSYYKWDRCFKINNPLYITRHIDSCNERALLQLGKHCDFLPRNYQDKIKEYVD